MTVQPYQSIFIECGQQLHWVLVLDKYERDNLLWLFNVIGYPGIEPGEEGKPNPKKATVEPFHNLNNGDWVGQIASKLCYLTGVYNESAYFDAKFSPNGGYSSDELRSRIDNWFQSKIKEMSLTEIMRIKQSSAHDVGEAFANLPVEPLQNGEEK